MAANNYRGQDTAADSSGFVAIDEDCIGTGADADQTRPFSTWLCNRIVGNLLYLAENGRQISWQPYNTQIGLTSNSGDRPYASLRWTTIGLWHLPVSRGLTGVRIGLLANVQAYAGQTQSDVKLRVDFGAASRTFPLSNTYNSGPSYEPGSTTLSTYEVALPATVRGDDSFDALPLRLWIQSLDAGSRTGTETVSFWDTKVEADATSTFFNESSSGNPTSDSLEIQYLRITSGGNFTTENFDLLGRVQGTQQAVLIDGNAVLGSVTVQRYYMSYVQFRGIWVEPIYDPDYVFSIGQEDIEPSKTPPGPVFDEIMRGIQYLYTRPTAVAIGPRGVRDSGQETFNDYQVRWPWVDGDDSATAIVETPVMLDAENPIVEVRMSVVVVHGRQNPQAPYAGSALLEQAPGSAEWTLALLVDTRDEGALGGSSDWSTHNTSVLEAAASYDVELPMYPASYYAPQPLLRQLAQMDTYDGYDVSYAYKEGQLYEEDLKLVEEISLIGRLSSFTTANAYPARVRVTGVLKSGSTPNYTSGDNNSTAYVRLICVGYTVIMRPSTT